jgi:endonuclease/exonuclease/phosphatase (EEP) superfamily protein YafD
MELIRAVAFLIAAASAMAAALSLGGAISARLDIFAQLIPFWLAGAIVALMLQAIARGDNRSALALSGFAIIACLGLMAPELIAKATLKLAPRTGQTLKVIQFNLWDKIADPNAAADWIIHQSPDVVVLEEAGERGAAVVDKLRALYPYRAGCPDEQDCATVILSKVAARQSGDFAWPGLGERHANAWATFGEGAEAFSVVGTHYPWPIPAGPLQAHRHRLAGFLGQFDKKSLIVSGDFNATPWSFALRRQDALFGLERRTLALATWPAAPITRRKLTLPFPLLAIDHVYAGTAWRTVSVARGPRLGSDHYPVVVELVRSTADAG